MHEDRNLLSVDIYKFGRDIKLAMITSGCPNQCKLCCIAVLHRSAIGALEPRGAPPGALGSPRSLGL